MSLAARNDEMDLDRHDFDDGSFDALESELKKGLQSLREGKLITIDEAWADIDQV